MEYFKKIQCYKPSTGIIDAPISIEEVALLQDSVDKNMLGRIKFSNYSKQTIVAIFVQMRAANIAGELVDLEKARFIYQDMKISPGELYGNAIPIPLPEEVRYFSVQLEKVVFDDGEIWDSANETTCKISQKEIQVPDQIIDRVKKELEKHLNNVDYVRYFYEEGQNFWECSCGKVNSVEKKVCSFCSNSQDIQRDYLTEERINNLVAEKKQEIEDEKQKKLLIEEEKKRIEEEKNRKIQQERLEKWDQLKKQQEEAERKNEIVVQKKKKIYKAIFCIASVAVIILLAISYRNTEQEKARAYQAGMKAYEQKNYELAIEKFNVALSYKDSLEKLEESLKKQTKKDKKELKKIFKNTLATEEVNSLIDVLCYMNKPESFVEKYSDFVFIKNLGARQDLCNYRVGDNEYMILDFGYDDNLKEITFYGNSESFDQTKINTLLRQEYDDNGYSSYIWNTKNNIFSEVVLEDRSSLKINDETVEFDYELTFYQ